MGTVCQGNNRLQAMRASKFCGVFMTTAKHGDAWTNQNAEMQMGPLAKRAHWSVQSTMP
jgi:hypothetical protein